MESNLADIAVHRGQGLCKRSSYGTPTDLVTGTAVAPH